MKLGHCHHRLYAAAVAERCHRYLHVQSRCYYVGCSRMRAIHMSIRVIQRYAYFGRYLGSCIPSCFFAFCFSA